MSGIENTYTEFPCPDCGLPMSREVKAVGAGFFVKGSHDEPICEAAYERYIAPIHTLTEEGK